jgi:hypothetical protein
MKGVDLLKDGRILPRGFHQWDPTVRHNLLLMTQYLTEVAVKL